MVQVYVILILRGMRKLSTTPSKIRNEVEVALKEVLAVEEIPSEYQ